MRDGLDELDTFAPSQAVIERLQSDPASLQRAVLRACAAGNDRLLSYLLQACTDSETAYVQARDPSLNRVSTPAIIEAAAHRKAECVRLLVEHGAQIDAQDDAGWTALHWAICANDTALTFFLVNRGASLEVKSHKGLTAVDIATSDTLKDMLRPSAVDERKKRRLEHAFEAARALDLDLGLLNEEDEPIEAEEPMNLNEFRLEDSLAFTIASLSSFFDKLITFMPAHKQRSKRTLPAFAIFLAARFAVHEGTEEMLDELLLGTMERIESVMQDRATDLGVLSFWLSNVLLLLHLLRRDPKVARATADELQGNLADLIGEIVVYIVRDTERRCDKILDAAMLEYESLPDLEVRFADEWRMPKALGGGSVGRSFFANNSRENTPPPHDSPGRGSSIRRGQSMTNLRSPSLQTTSPRTVTQLLSGVMFVLQSYEVPPSIIVQVFSQVIYWLACESCNRILTRRRFLCRSKAIQIRLNASSIEDWARLNKFPTKLATSHFAPLNQLVQWLQILSSEQSLDGLLATLQNLPALNPTQLRRAVREYRYEVDEPKPSEDVLAYLAQMQKDYERRRLTSAGIVQRREVSAADSLASEQSAVSVHLDQVFLNDNHMSYVPPAGPESLSELLDSRHMLPFALPNDNDLLVAHGCEFFGPFARNDPPAPRPEPYLWDVAIIDSQQLHYRRSNGAGLGLGLSDDASNGR